MKKVGAIFYLLLCSGLLYSFSYQEGQEYKHRNYYDSKCDCYVWEMYLPDGKLYLSEQFSDSLFYIKNGQSTYFHANGSTRDITIFVNGNREGYSYSQSPNGIIGAERFYTNGKLDSSKYYNEEGKLTEATIYFDNGSSDYEVSRLVRYYPNGNDLVFTEYYEPNKNEPKITVVDSLLYKQMLDSLAKRTGKELFAQNCTSCHNPYKDVVGPKLVGVTNRRSDKWIRSWIRNSAKMIANGDKQAVALYSEWHKTAMTSFPDLSKEDINKLMEYLASL